MLQMHSQPICQPAETVPMLSQCKCQNKTSDGKNTLPVQSRTKRDIPFSFVGIPQMLETCASFGLVLTNILQPSPLLPY